MVSNAGYGLFGAGEELSDEQIDQQLATNLSGPIQLYPCQPTAPPISGGGRIVQVSPRAGRSHTRQPLSCQQVRASKASVEAVALRLPFGIDYHSRAGAHRYKFWRCSRSRSLPRFTETPAGEVRRLVASGEFVIRGDAHQHPSTR